MLNVFQITTPSPERFTGGGINGKTVIPLSVRLTLGLVKHRKCVASRMAPTWNVLSEGLPAWVKLMKTLSPMFSPCGSEVLTVRFVAVETTKPPPVNLGMS